jgi:hypothetical protein
MHWRECLRIGINHHLLHAGGCDDPGRHAATLLPLLADPRFEVVDLWIPAEAACAAREVAACRDSGKQIVYNIGGRKGRPSPQPAALDGAVWQRSLDFYREELDRALAAGAVKVVTNSGADQPAAREAAREQLVRFYQVICRHVPPTVTILIEPTDRTLDKRKLIGPSAEAAALCRRLRAEGCTNFASMIDMGHVPLLGETLPQAFQDSAGCLGHIHLGNCILRSPHHPLFGDKHVPWGIAEGEYGTAAVAELLRLGQADGYFGSASRGTVSFEMRPYPELGPLASLDRFFAILNEAWGRVGGGGAG